MCHAKCTEYFISMTNMQNKHNFIHFIYRKNVKLRFRLSDMTKPQIYIKILDLYGSSPAYL